MSFLDVVPDPMFRTIERTPSAEELRFFKIRDKFRLVDVSLDLLAALEKGGKEFIPIERPKGYRRQRKQKECFYNATHVALRDHWRRDGGGDGATYVEGIAWDERLGCGFHHAWITLDGEHAVDQTWTRLGDKYFGIAVPAKQLISVMARTKYYGSVITELDGSAS